MAQPPEAPPRRMPSWLPQIFGYALSLACLVWVFRGYNFREIPSDIRSLDWRWVAVGVAADLAVYLTHALRWNTLLSPVVRLRPWRTVQAIYIGLFANEVLPLRTGELIRCYLLAHWNDFRLSLSITSAAVERLIDGFWMITAFIVTASLVKGIPERLIIPVQLMGVLLVAGAALLIWIVSHKQHAHLVAAESRWASTLRHVVEGLHLMGNLRTMGLTIVISLLYLFLSMFSYYALMRAYGLDLSLWAACGVLTIVRLATVIPNAPGNLGFFQAACVLALGLFDVEKNDATTFSFVLFFAVTLPLLIGGAIAVALTGLNIGELRDRAHRSAKAAKHDP